MKIIANILIILGVLILLLTFGRPGTVAGVQTVISGAGGVAGGSGEKVSLLPVEATPAAGEGELGGGVSTEEGEVQGEAAKRASRLPFIAGGFGLLLIAGTGYFYWKRNKI